MTVCRSSHQPSRTGFKAYWRSVAGGVLRCLRTQGSCGKPECRRVRRNEAFAALQLQIDLNCAGHVTLSHKSAMVAFGMRAEGILRSPTIRLRRRRRLNTPHKTNFPRSISLQFKMFGSCVLPDLRPRNSNWKKDLSPPAVGRATVQGSRMRYCALQILSPAYPLICLKNYRSPLKARLYEIILMSPSELGCPKLNRL